ncbi:hypothetical protein V7O66_04095 [Methanolobus sp. ZRKC3]|uniref:hypothetical protein n=1 Tax=Methanolobus sp. ZRKC3 TaxID=3125786 RepID=UPI00324A9203
MKVDVKIIIAGFLALFVVVGHFVFGSKWYLRPMLDSNMELIPKAILQSVFHYVSIYLLLSSITLLLIGFGIFLSPENVIMVKFIGLNYLLFALVQIFYSIKNKVPNPLITMFQWTLFLPIGILCII